MLACSRSNICMAGPSATIVDAKFAFEASEVNMNSGITSRAAIARSSACSTVTKLAASRPRGGEVVLQAGGRVEDRAGAVLRDSAACGRSTPLVAAGIGVGGDELLDAAAARAAVLADQRDRRLDLGHDAHVAQQLLGPPQILSHRRVQRQAALHVEVDVRAAMLDVAGVDELAVDVVAEHGFHVVRHRSGCRSWPTGSAAQLGRRRDLVRLDEPHARQAVVVDEEPQERFAVAIDAADDLLLPLVPAILVLKLVEHLLHLPAPASGAARPCPCRRSAR